MVEKVESAVTLEYGEYDAQPPKKSNKKKWIIGGVIFAAIAALAIGLGVGLSGGSSDSSSSETLAVVGAEAESTETEAIANASPRIIMYSIGEPVTNDGGISLDLTATSANTKGIQKLQFELINDDENRARVRIIDPANARYEIPEDIAPIFSSSRRRAASNVNYDATVENDRLKITRKGQDSAIVDLDLASIIYEDQHISLAFNVGSNPLLYGLGEHLTEKFYIKENTYYNMWNTDQYGTPLYITLYGSHPYFVQLKDGQAHSVFLRNANGQDWFLSGNTLTVDTIGGIVDLFVFTGPTFKDACLQYQEVIGNSLMPPYWALGFHQSRFGLENVSMVERTVNGFIEAEIPLEVMYTDIDYMHLWWNWSNDKKNFPVETWRPFVDKLRNELHRHYVLILDPAIPENALDDPVYEGTRKAVEMNVLLKNKDGELYRGRQWVGDAFIFDPTAPNAQEYWTKMTKDFYENVVPVDGMWIDMNEFASFCHGEVNTVMPKEWYKAFSMLWSYPCWAETPEQLEMLNGITWEKAAEADFDIKFPNGPGPAARDYSNDKLNTPVSYSIWASSQPTDPERSEKKPLYFKTLDMHALYYDNTTYYDQKNLYGNAQTHVMHQTMIDIDGKRPFVLTRATYPGAGNKAGHWTGDNTGNWEQLKYSMNIMLQHQLFGILFIGDDICGFVKDVDDPEEFEEMCSRWMAVGAFWPFSRNHYADSNDMLHEPWMTPGLAFVSKAALEERYKILPYFYTLFHDAHTGETPFILHSLVFDYPEDVKVTEIHDQFTVGEAIMIVPITDQGKTSRSAYFPGSQPWYDWRTGALFAHGGETKTVNSDLSNSDEVIPMFVVGGHVIPKQESALTIKEARTTPMTLVAALTQAVRETGVSRSTGASAKGHLYWDNGVQLELKSYFTAEYDASPVSFKASVSDHGFAGAAPAIGTIKLFGMEQDPDKVTLGDKNIPYTFANGVLIVDMTGLDLTAKDDFELQFGGGAMASDAVGGYKAGSVANTDNGFTVELTATEGNTGIQKLQLEAVHESDYRLRIRITDPNNKRFEIPNDVVPVFTKAGAADLPAYDASIVDNVLSVSRAGSSRRDNAEPLFKIDLGGLIYEDQYIRVDFKTVPNPKIYGLGEHLTPELEIKEGKIYTLWNLDQYGTPPYINLYGSHPYFTENRAGQIHAVYWHNANGQDWILRGDTFTANVIGGIVDLFVFTGPTFKDVGNQLTEVVGRSMMPPYWALGFHQSRFGMENVSMVERTVQGFIDTNIPLEVMYTDIDYMHIWRDWTNHHVNFPLDIWRPFVDRLRGELDRHYVLILDPMIAEPMNETDDYEGYRLGIELDVFVKDENGENYRSRQWVGDGHAFDPTAKNAQKYWSTMTKDWFNYEGVKFDGLWIDMNEIASFCHGEVNTVMPPGWYSKFGLLWSWPCWAETDEDREILKGVDYATASVTDFSGQITNGGYRVHNDSLNMPASYVIWNTAQPGDAERPSPNPLTYKTMDMTAKFANGHTQYDMHNLYGIATSKILHQTLIDIDGKRPFALTRATFPGSGTHAGHWTGDNVGNWDHLKWSINIMLREQLVGILFVGDDICGFVKDVDDPDEFEEMCSRWMAVGAFWPFSRNHYADSNNMKHEPWMTEGLAYASRAALEKRYQLLPYMYTLFHDAHTGISPYILHGLVFDWPEDDEAVAHSIDSFTLGGTILIAPVLEKGITERPVYFPKTTWYDWRTGKKVSAEGGESKDFESKIDNAENVLLMFVRSGVIIPTQESALTIKEARTTPFTLTATLGSDAPTAEGHLYWDDGEQLELKAYFEANYTASAHGFKASVENHGYNASPAPVGTVRIYGLEKAPAKVTLVDADVPFEFDASDVLTVDLTDSKLTALDNFELSFA